jgi:hypothetical protein
VYCKKCGRQLPDNAKFCDACGTATNVSLSSDAAPTASATRATPHESEAEIAGAAAEVARAGAEVARAKADMTRASTDAATSSISPKSSRNTAKRAGIGFLIFVGVAALVLGYFGFLPGLSHAFGSDKPIDLGARYSGLDYLNANAKSGIRFGELPVGTPAEQSLRYSGQKEVNVDFTPAEFNALLNERRWEYYPFSDFQYRTNTDGTSEFSAVLHIDRVDGYCEAMGIPDETEQKVMNYLKSYGRFQKQVPVYIKSKAGVADGQLDFQTYEAKVGRFPISGARVDQYKDTLIRLAYSRIDSIPGFSCNSFGFSPDGVHFEGSLPTMFERVTR